MINSVVMPIIGYMHSPYNEKFGIPRQPNLVQVESYIDMIEPYNDILAFEGIEEFSHLWLLWQFHENKNNDNSLNQMSKFRPQVRPPRLGGNQKIGVFATRSMYRPSPIGLSVVRFLRVEKQGKTLRLYVTGSDLLNGTPADAVSGYAQDVPKRKNIVWSESAQIQQFDLIKADASIKKKLEELVEVLSLDPRPAYHDDEERVYKMKFSEWDVNFKIVDDRILILSL